MKKNKLLSLIICTVMLFSIPIVAFAHPGRTDEYGGHYDWKTGEYHYHHGYPAHQHIDGYCPYDYDDQTDHSNHGGGVSNSTQEKHYSSSTTETETKKELTFFETIICSLAISGLILGPLAAGAMFFICGIVALIIFKIYEILGICNKGWDILKYDDFSGCRLALNYLLVFAFLTTSLNQMGELNVFCLYLYVVLCCVTELTIVLPPLVKYFKDKSYQKTENNLDRLTLREEPEEQDPQNEQECKNPTITAEETEQTPEIIEETVEKKEQPPEEVVQEEPKLTIEPTRKIYHYHTQSHIMPVDPKHVYWTANGKSYHSNRRCLALRNCATVSSGTLTKAQRLGHKTPCSVCVGKNYKVKKK